MSILATNKNKKVLRKKADAWIYISIFVCLFGRIYEQFSHEIYSFKMMYAFGYTLIFGCLVRIFLLKFRFRIMPGYLTNSIYNCGVVTLTLGSIIDGAFYIYGTSNAYLKYYYYVGAGMMAFAVALFALAAVFYKGER